jgi:hypothetical protein
VEVAAVVVAQFKDGKLLSEHIYWDQASVLVQLGKLDPKGLPVGGVDRAAQFAPDPRERLVANAPGAVENAR